MKWFKIIDNIVELNREEIALYPNVRKILTRDKGGKVIGDPDGRKKLFAFKELSYVYFMCDFYAYPTQSGLSNFDAHKWTIKTVGLSLDYKPDEDLLVLMAQYTKEHLSPAKRSIKNLLRLFGMTDSILEKIEPRIKQLLDLPTLSIEQVDELIKLQSDLIKFSTSIPANAKLLREAMTILEEEEKSVRIARGSRLVDESQDPDNLIEREG
jgi:hypothetical protein